MASKWNFVPTHPTGKTSLITKFGKRPPFLVLLDALTSAKLGVLFHSTDDGPLLLEALRNKLQVKRMINDHGKDEYCRDNELHISSNY